MFREMNLYINKNVKSKTARAAVGRIIRKAAGKGHPTFSLNQPEPFTPEITRAMVRNHLRQLYKDKMLDHRPPTAAEWVLAEWYLAQKLRLSPLRTAFFAAETVNKHGFHDRTPTRKPARRHCQTEL